MKRIVLALSVCLALLLVLSADDVTGYRSGANVWLLGAKLQNVNLKGFSETAVGNEAVTAFYDPSRTIQFEKQDADVSAALFELGGRLTGVVIAVPATERPFKYLRKYYTGRLSGCDQTVDQGNECVWCDEEGDFLILAKAQLNDGSPVTLVIYVRGEELLGTSGSNVQQWMLNLFSNE